MAEARVTSQVARASAESVWEKESVVAPSMAKEAPNLLSLPCRVEDWETEPPAVAAATLVPSALEMASSSNMDRG